MTHEVIMPKLGETMEEGYLVSWKYKVGDKVEKGEVLFEVMSDKTNFDVEAASSGYLRKILVEASDNAIPVTSVIGYLTDKADEPVVESAPAGQTAQPAAPPPVSTYAVETAAAAPVSQPGERIFISPLARRLAAEKGIDIATVKGTGPDGRIEKKDILDHISTYAVEMVKAPAAAGGYTVKEWTPLRKIIAERLTKSKTTIPHYYVQGKIMMDQIARLKELKKKAGEDFSYTDFIVYITARAVAEYPLIGAAVVNNEIRVHSTVEMGLAVAVEDGLVVPVIKNAAGRTMKDIAADIRALSDRARNNRLQKSDTEDCRFVISNLGMFGVESFLPIVNPPGTAIMGIGAIENTPLAVNGRVEIHPVMYISLSLDHRVIDGAYGGKFFKRLKELMENPALLAC